MKIFIKDPIIFFEILLPFKIWEINISKDNLLISGLITYIIDEEIKKFNSWINVNTKFFLFRSSFELRESSLFFSFVYISLNAFIVWKNNSLIGFTLSI